MKFFLTCLAMVGLSRGYPFNDKVLGQIRKPTTLPATCNCGFRNSGRIVGGRETRRNEYPWKVVQIIRASAMCGGSIITPFHVLTAAHCTDGVQANEIIIFVGKHNLTDQSDGTRYFIEKIIQHENYKTDPTINDVSILVTATIIRYTQNVSPICLPKERYNLKGQQLRIMGWGKTESLGYNTVLHAVDLEYVPLEKCKQVWKGITEKDTQICAYGHEKDSCNGDSGGGLIYLNTDNNRYTQVALVSYGDVNCASEHPSVNTDVHAFMDWIIHSVTSSKPGLMICTGY